MIDTQVSERLILPRKKGGDMALGKGISVMLASLAYWFCRMPRRASRSLVDSGMDADVTLAHSG